MSRLNYELSREIYSSYPCRSNPGNYPYQLNSPPPPWEQILAVQPETFGLIFCNREFMPRTYLCCRPTKILRLLVPLEKNQISWAIYNQFCWPSLHTDVAAYVAPCSICAQNKSSQHPYMGLLQPISNRERSWPQLAMYFIVDLSWTHGF